MQTDAPRRTAEPTTTSAPSAPTMGTTKATLLVVLTSILMGSVPVFARELTDAGLSAVSVSFYRNLLGTVVLFRLLRFDGPRRVATFWALGAGVGMGLGWTAYVRAVEVMPVSTAGVIYMSYPLFAIVLAWGLFRQVPATRSLISGLVVLAATIVAMGPEIGGDTEVVVLAFAAPLSFGFAVAVLTEKLATLRPIERVAPIAFGSTIGLLPIMATQTFDESIPADLTTWAYAVGIALFTAIGPQWMYSAAAPNVGPARAAIAGSTELPMMFLVGYLWFDETLTWQQGLAGLMVLGAILIVPSRQSPGLTMVRRKRRLVPGRFYKTHVETPA
ncbi:MAG: DMT family transporter [Actinomycetota bacterium]